MFNIFIPALFAGHTYGFLIGVIVGFVMMVVVTVINKQYMFWLSTLDDQKLGKELKHNEPYWRLKRRRASVAALACLIIALSGLGHAGCHNLRRFTVVLLGDTLAGRRAKYVSFC